MGFYDTTCLVSGVHLPFVEATAVLLHRTAAGQYHPISLGIRGTYDGYGSLEMIDPDPHLAAVTTFFSNAHRAQRFQAYDATHAGDVRWFDPDIAIDSLLYLVERTTTCADLSGGLYPPSTVLDGDPVVMAMIAQPIWDAITAGDRPRRRDLAAAAFGAGLPTAVEIYGAAWEGHLLEPLRQLAAVADFITTRPPLRWAPPGEPEQRYPRGSGHQFTADECRRFLDQARRDYHSDAAILGALDTWALE